MYDKIFLRVRRRYKGSENATGIMTIHKRNRDGICGKCVQAFVPMHFWGRWRVTKKKNGTHIAECRVIFM